MAATFRSFLLPLLALASLSGSAEAPPSSKPDYRADGTLRFPERYREWVFLSSGVNMTYGPSAVAEPDTPVFDNVFVDPDSYRSFLESGKWRDGTVLVLEIRRGSNKGSINKNGHFQAADLRDIEVHVKDTARFPDGGWAFFGYDKAGGGGKIFPRQATCYSCHAAHGIVDTTFVQFYPTLLPVARAKGTINSTAAPEDSLRSGQ